MQGAAVEPGWRLDLRGEYIKQDQPGSGRHDVNAGQISHHHDEVETRNRNLLATLDYFAVTPGAQIYGFVQAPLYQNVNGVQLTADWSVAAGVSIRF